ncbi:alpha/beta-hydrolase [Sanghuangporus baumii]|uniref:Alpha/beta-hydrolase n=1 Tax=Sanghuangporus baumii TaxID=108892 RepID=A0A9Q5NCE5_SANBA|nr:alpha/beta-hydrolase [Sanghuangporus baumii]
MTTTPDVRVLTSSDGCRIYADAVGDSSKPCLVFIHGFSLSAAVFDNIFFDARYSSEFFLVRYDMRGHGRSGKPDTIDEYASKLYADDFAAVLHTFKVRRPVVVTWSLGATVTADIAAHLPQDTLAGIVYMAPCPYIGLMPSIGTPFILNLLYDITSADDATSADDNMQIFFNSCFTDAEKTPWETRALWQGMSTFQRPRHRRFVVSRTQDPTRLLQLGTEGLPVLVLIGTKDPQIRTESLRTEMKKSFSNVDFYALEGAGHSIHYENKNEVMKRIMLFAKKTLTVRKKSDNICRVEKQPGSFLHLNSMARVQICSSRALFGYNGTLAKLALYEMDKCESRLLESIHGQPGSEEKIAEHTIRAKLISQ